MIDYIIMKIGNKRVITSEDIISYTCGVFNIPKNLLKEKNRKRNIVDARRVYAYLMNKHTDYSFDKNL